MADSLVVQDPWLPKNLKRNTPIRVWGIDLGTTNSTVTEIIWSPHDPEHGRPRVRCLELDQPTKEGVFTGPLVPSVLAVLPSGDVWVGEGAKRLRTRPQEVSLITEKTLFFETKNDMGLRKTYYRAPDALNCAWKIGGHILQFLKDQARQVTGDPPDRIVVSVPASFQLNQRRDTLLAAQQAGLNLQVYDLLDEPTAALMAYMADHSGENLLQVGNRARILVFDFGGGTGCIGKKGVDHAAFSCGSSWFVWGVSMTHRALRSFCLSGTTVHDKKR